MEMKAKEKNFATTCICQGLMANPVLQYVLDSKFHVYTCTCTGTVQQARKHTVLTVLDYQIMTCLINCNNILKHAASKYKYTGIYN